MEVIVCFSGRRTAEPRRLPKKSHELLLARGSDAAEAAARPVSPSDLVTVLGVARLNQHNLMLGVHACHT